MVITNKLKFDTPRLGMGGVDIGMSDKIKILGLTIDQKLTFNDHVASTCKKVIGIYKQLATAAKTSWGLHPEVIRTIYTAVVEPIVLYAAGAWVKATNKIYTQNKLDAVQRGFAQKLCRAYRTVSLNSALVLAGILPLDIRIKEAARLYEARRGVPQPELKDRTIEKMHPATKLPHPATQIRRELLQVCSQADLDRNNKFEVKIFTDGSKINDQVGAALSLWKGTAETKVVKLALPSYCTVYQAELLAICRASEEIKKRSETSYAIYSDSMAALQTVINIKCLHPLAVKTRGNLGEISLQNKTTALFWIKAHAGIAGNERADELAKEAASNTKKKANYELCPISFVKRLIRRRSLDEWNNRYKNGSTAAITKIFFPDAIEAYRAVRKLTVCGRVTQIMTGHGGFSEYLNRFKCKESPSCICDPEESESVPHLLFECPIYAKARYELELEIKTELKRDNVYKIISGNNRDKLIIYCKNICQIVNNRNK